MVAFVLEYEVLRGTCSEGAAGTRAWKHLNCRRFMGPRKTSLCKEHTAYGFAANAGSRFSADKRLSSLPQHPLLAGRTGLGVCSSPGRRAQPRYSCVELRSMPKSGWRQGALKYLF